MLCKRGRILFVWHFKMINGKMSFEPTWNDSSKWPSPLKDDCALCVWQALMIVKATLSCRLWQNVKTPKSLIKTTFSVCRCVVLPMTMTACHTSTFIDWCWHTCYFLFCFFANEWNGLSHLAFYVILLGVWFFAWHAHYHNYSHVKVHVCLCYNCATSLTTASLSMKHKEHGSQSRTGLVHAMRECWCHGHLDSCLCLPCSEDVIKIEIWLTRY